LFPAGLDGPNDHDSYKKLWSSSLRSDLALLSILDEIALRWPGIETSKVFMMGFSGGGQFAHRFLYIYPERLAAVSVGAPGRVTALDNRTWPFGIADVEAVFGRQVQPDLIKDVVIQLVVGGADVAAHGGDEFSYWLKQQKLSRAGRGGRDSQRSGTEPMDKSRLKTIQELQIMWENFGIKSKLDVVEGVAHSSDGVRECVFEFLRPLMQKAAGPTE
jgi:pimeloyl-ACP methyl ester carboxylesterase